MTSSGSTFPEDTPSQLAIWVEATLPRALGYALSLVPERADAEDLVHDCYMRLLAKSDTYDLPHDGTKLLYRSITHACINWQQRRPPVVRFDAQSEVPASACPQAGPEQLAMYGELEAAVGNALSALPISQRAAVELRSLGHSLAEVAEILDLSPGNARVVLHRARQALAVRLAGFLKVEGADS